MCPFKYWLTYCLKVKLKTNFGAVHGNLLHDILEYYAKREDRDWMRRLYEGYSGRLQTENSFGQAVVLESPLQYAKDKDYKEQTPLCDTCPFKGDGICNISREPLDDLSGCPKKLFQESINLMEYALAKYGDSYDDGSLIGAEYRFKHQPETWNVPGIGIMDLVRRVDDETVEIIDYKTGNWVNKYDECIEDIQPRFYSMIGRKIFVDDIENQGYNFKNVFVTFDYFKGQTVRMAFSEEDDRQTEIYIANIIQKIQDTDLVTRIAYGDNEFKRICYNLCDVAVCSNEWKGNFSAREANNGTL
jgi:hypothetical protein